jgi:hypothetical protein
MAAAWDRIAERGDEDRISHSHRAHGSARHAPIPVHSADRLNAPSLCFSCCLGFLCARCCALLCSALLLRTTSLRLQTPLQSARWTRRRGEERERAEEDKRGEAEDAHGALTARCCHAASPCG